MKKRFSAYRLLPMLSLLALLLVLTACGGEDLSSQEDEPAVLVYGTVSPEYSSTTAVRHFCQAHPEITVEIRDYSEYAGGVQQLMKEMTAGTGPDILDLGNWGPSGEEMPYRQLAEKGFLEDLWPWIEGDPDLGREALVEALLLAAEIDGGLYLAFGSVGITTLAGAERLVGDRHSWSLADLWAALEAMPEGSTVAEYFLPAGDILYYLLSLRAESYVDWETGECSFDGEDFRSLLEFCGSFPAQLEVTDWDEANEEQRLRFSQGRQLLKLAGINDLSEISFYNEDFEAALGSPCVFVGFPVEDGSAGSYFGVSGTRFAMNAASGNKEAAWTFIREVFLPRYEEGLNPKEQKYVETVRGKSSYGLPVNRADFETKQRIAMKGWEASEDSAAPEYVPVTQAEMDRFMEFYNSIRRTNLYDNTIFDLVMEQCRPYFAGELTLDETVDRIQSRVSLYVNESR